VIKPRKPAKPAKKPAATKKPGARVDYGAPVDGWFAKQPQPQRAIAAALRALVREAAPEAVGSLKWGMPFYTAGGMMCAIAAHKSHVNLILSGPPGAFADPDELLEGDGKTGRHLKLRTLDDMPGKDVVRGWMRTAAALARKAGK
jgi:hypothetical protein